MVLEGKTVRDKIVEKIDRNETLRLVTQADVRVAEEEGKEKIYYSIDATPGAKREAERLGIELEFRV